MIVIRKELCLQNHPCQQLAFVLLMLFHKLVLKPLLLIMRNVFVVANVPNGVRFLLLLDVAEKVQIKGCNPLFCT